MNNSSWGQGGAGDAVALAAVVPVADGLARFEEVLRLRGLAVATRTEYLRYLRQLVAHAGGAAEGLDETAVRAFLLHLHTERCAAPSRLRSAYAAMRLFYRTHLGRDWRLMAVARAPKEHRLPRALSREQVARLLAAVTEPRFRVLLRLIYACGLRVGEAVGLAVTDIDRDGPYVWVRHGKGNRSRRVPLPEAMLAELRDWWRLHRHPRWLFPAVGTGWSAGPFGHGYARLRGAVRPMGPETVQMRVKRARRAAGLPARTTPHTLRHSYATHLLEEGVCIRAISACLGHSSIQITLLYASMTPPSEARVRVVAAGLLSGGGIAKRGGGAEWNEGTGE